jgi:2-phospho-L-lactate guanylyltransferase
MNISSKIQQDQIVVLIPVKTPNLAKSRMLESISQELIQQLVKAMLLDVISVIIQNKNLYPVVVAPDDSYELITQEFNIDTFIDSGSGYNECILEFSNKYLVNMNNQLIIIPGDQPRISKQELDIFLDKMHHIDVVQVVAEDGGTGALGLSPYNIMPTAFGVNSSSKHRNYAISHNLSFFQFEDIGLSYDIDQYQDLRLATKHSFGSNTQLVVQKLFNNIH